MTHGIHTDSSSSTVKAKHLLTEDATNWEQVYNKAQEYMKVQSPNTESIILPAYWDQTHTFLPLLLGGATEKTQNPSCLSVCLWHKYIMGVWKLSCLLAPFI